MATETRSGVLGGEDIALRVLVFDSSGQLRDTDALPVVYIYEESIDYSDIQEEVDSGIFTNALGGPFAATKIGTGYYEFVYTVPSGADPGFWHDVWIGAIDGAEIANIQTFKVTQGGAFTTQTIGFNQLIYLELDESIASLDGEKTLGGDYTFSFLTVLKPFYASVELARMEGGPLLEYLPDDTLALLIHWASLEADSISPIKKCPKYPFWRTRFVILEAALRALMMPGGAFVNGLNGAGGGSKALGELSIKKGSTGVSSSMSGGLDKDTFDNLKKMRDELWRVVNAGGCINPGEGLGMTGAIRGIFDPARGKTGRLWEDANYEIPTINTKVRGPSWRMWKHAYRRYYPGSGRRGYDFSGGSRYNYD